MSRQTEEKERLDAIQELRAILRPGDVVPTILRHVSRSGMQRVIDPFIVKGDLRSIGYLAAKAIRHRYDAQRNGIVMQGCGMDMGFDLVYQLSYALWPTGFQCAGPNCPSNDHSNPSHPVRDGAMHHTDGGYALRQRWL